MLKTNGKRNRQAGHQLERTLAEIFRAIGFPHVVTSRSESRSRDAQKIDLMNKEERVNGRFPYNVQAKNSTVHLKYAKLLAEIPEVPQVMNVVIHKQTQKVGTRFLPTGEYAIMSLKDFLTLVQQRDERRTVRGSLVQPAKKRTGKAVLPKAERHTETGIQPAPSVPKAN